MIKRDHPLFQKGPVGIERGQYPGIDKEHIANIEQIEYIKNIDG
jgi:hypothetical protein